MPNRWGEGKSFQMTPNLKALFDGLLMGDGNYAKLSVSSKLRFGQKSNHKDWIDSIQKILSEDNVSSQAAIYPAHKRVIKSGQFAGKLLNVSEFITLSTPNYRNLFDERLRWYPDGTKIVPKDIDISNPLLLAQWYMGDGNMDIGTGRYEIGIHTNSFTDDDVLWLRDQFKLKLDIHANVAHWHKQPVLKLSHFNANRFVQIVKPHIVPSSYYKVPDNPWKPGLCQTCGADLVGVQRKHCSSCQPKVRREQKRLRRKIVKVSDNGC